jgi:Asp-tRNA(Asn)/Glu-tRNA(Gln) amidotransferase A subunit family amidase
MIVMLLGRAGMIPLDVTSDIGGPITRTVEDAARVLEVLQGSDPADALTQNNPTPPTNYTQFLKMDGLQVIRRILGLSYAKHKLWTHVKGYDLPVVDRSSGWGLDC